MFELENENLIMKEQSIFEKVSTEKYVYKFQKASYQISRFVNKNLIDYRFINEIVTACFPMHLLGILFYFFGT